MKPNFLIIGTQKGGTTSLRLHLRLHPEIFMLEQEGHYFDQIHQPSLIDYEAQFDTTKKIRGEKTPMYFGLPIAIDRIHNTYPNIKLIILLREPISRCFSTYNMLASKEKMLPFNEPFINVVKDGAKVKRDYSTALAKRDIVISGYYYEQIRYILNKFPRENIHIVISEEMRANKIEEHNKIYEFLEAKKLDSLLTTHECNVRKYNREISDVERKFLRDVYYPHNEKLYEFLDRRIPTWEDYYNRYGI